MVRRALVVGVIAVVLVASGQNTFAQEGESSISKAIDLMGELQETYPTLNVPRQRLVVAGHMLTLIDVLQAKTAPPPDTARKLAEMRKTWSALRLGDFENTMSEVVQLNKAVGNATSDAARGALLRRALDNLDAMLANIPPGMEALRPKLAAQRGSVSAALQAAKSKAEGPPDPPPSPIVRVAYNAQPGYSDVGDPGIPSADGWGDDEPSMVQPSAAETHFEETAAPLSPFERVKRGISVILTLILGSAVFILFAGPILAVLRWAARNYVRATKTLWDRYGRKPVDSPDPEALA